MPDELIQKNLAQLKDIHLPEPISFWPAAPGWYLLTTLIFLFLIISFVFFMYWNMRHRRIKRIKKELYMLKEKHVQQPEKALEELSQFIRRVILIKYKRTEIASLQGEGWLQFLDKISLSENFTQGVGQILATAPFQKKPEVDMDKLIELIERLIKRLC